MGFFDLFGKNKKDDITLAESDKEKWIVATYAMWSEWADGDWRYFAGSKEKSRQEGASMRLMLRRDWAVNNQKELYDTISELMLMFNAGLAEDEDDREYHSVGGWDLCRACQILGMGFVGGYIEKKEMHQKCIEIGKMMQKHYRSWEELCGSYLKGYKEWRTRQGGEAEKDITDRENLYNQLRSQAGGPYTLPWNLELS